MSDRTSTMEARQELADKLLKMDTNTGRLADLFSPGSWGGERAGRAETLGRSSGSKIPFTVRHPTTSDSVNTAIGSLLGSAAGGATGLAVSNLSEGLKESLPTNTTIGAVVGAAGGGLLGHVLGVMRRRNAYRKLVKNYVAHGGDAKVPEFSGIASVVAPLRGPHRKGQMDAAKFIRGDSDKPRSAHSDLANVASNSASFIPGVGPLVPLGRGWVQNFRAADQAGAMKVPAYLT